MKKILFSVGCLCMATFSYSQPLTTPQLSPTQTLKQNFGLASIELSYSRPSVKGRKVFETEVAPYGKVWRTGANTATTLIFAEEVQIGGTKIPAGKYGLLSIPNRDEWTLIISKQLDVTSAGAYKQESDVVRYTAMPVRLSQPVETFTIQFANITAGSTDLQIMWENTMVTLPIVAETDKKIMAQIDNTLNKDNRPYMASAMYYVDNNKDLNQAVTWFDKAIEQNPKSFNAYYQKANALVKLGKKDEARRAANKSLELAKEAKNENSIKLNEKLLADLK
jgi:hypothetical protein